MRRAMGAALAGWAALGLLGCEDAAELTGGALPLVAANGFESCYQATERRTQLDEQQAGILCLGAQDDGPVACFVESDEALVLDDPLRIDLCRCALDAAPVRCFQTAERDTDLSEVEILSLCNAVTVNGLTFDCRPTR